jgi:hypothetical protein
MKTSRRGFFGLLLGAAVAPKAVVAASQSADAFIPACTPASVQAAALARFDQAWLDLQRAGLASPGFVALRGILHGVHSRCCQ